VRVPKVVDSLSIGNRNYAYRAVLTIDEIQERSGITKERYPWGWDILFDWGYHKFDYNSFVEYLDSSELNDEIFTRSSSYGEVGWHELLEWFKEDPESVPLANEVLEEMELKDIYQVFSTAKSRRAEQDARELLDELRERADMIFGIE